MGDYADYLIEQGEEQYFDHLAGHRLTRCDDCPYCWEEIERGYETEIKKKAKTGDNP